MLECPQGHLNPNGWQLCGECGAQLEEAQDLSTDIWYRTKWAIVGGGVLAALVIVGVIIGVLAADSEPAARSSEPTTTDQAVLEWWSRARDPFTDLQRSLADSQQALATADRFAMEDACQQMHDSADVELQAFLPTPSPELTYELEAATEDAHAAAHMCLAVLAGSVNSYDGEFAVDIDQAEKHLVAAQELVRLALAGAI